MIAGALIEFDAEAKRDRKTRYISVIGLNGDTGEKFPVVEKLDDDKIRRLQKIGALILVLGLIISLFGIVKTNRASHEQIASQNREVARANASAAEANKSAESERLARVKLESDLADRSLTPDQMDHLLAKAKKFSGQKVDILCFESSDNPSILMGEIWSVLLVDNWKPRIWFVSPNGYMQNGVGVAYVQGADKKTLDATNALYSVLQEQAGLTAFGSPGPKSSFKRGPPTELGAPLELKQYGFVIETWNDSDEAGIRITVGPKARTIGADDENRMRAIEKMFADDSVFLHCALSQMQATTQALNKAPPKPKQP